MTPEVPIALQSNLEAIKTCLCCTAGMASIAFAYRLLTKTGNHSGGRSNEIWIPATEGHTDTISYLSNRDTDYSDVFLGLLKQSPVLLPIPDKQYFPNVHRVFEKLAYRALSKKYKVMVFSGTPGEWAPTWQRYKGFSIHESYQRKSQDDDLRIVGAKLEKKFQGANYLNERILILMEDPLSMITMDYSARLNYDYIAKYGAREEFLFMVCCHENDIYTVNTQNRFNIIRDDSIEQ